MCHIKGSVINKHITERRVFTGYCTLKPKRKSETTVELRVAEESAW